MDVRDVVAVKASLRALPVDLLVCAAGVTGDTPLLKYDEGLWDEIMAVNYHGAANCVDAVLPGMVRSGKGHIVFISSHSALHPPAGQAAYASAKAALLGLSRSIAERYGRIGIRSNVVLPGFLETRMTDKVTAVRKAKVLEAHAMGKFNTPERVAKFIRFLHEELPQTSGQVFQLDSRVS